jgi:hypothetical protein
MSKILLALQYWDGDKAQAMELARLIADLEPKHCDIADFLFVNRFDCKPDEVAIQYVGRKFNTFKYKSPGRGVGWPDGCNTLWGCTLEWFYHMKVAKKIPQYKAILTFEADCVPLRSDWIHFLIDGWDSLQPTYVAGARVEAVGIHEHINGNAFFSGDKNFLHWVVKRTRIPPGVGWDYWLANEFRKWGWAELPGMCCRWGTKTFTEKQFKDEVSAGTAFLHGVKDDSALKMSRKLLLT